MFRFVMDRLKEKLPPKPSRTRPRRVGYRTATPPLPAVLGGSEEGVRTRLIDSFLRCAHGDLNKFNDLHQAALQQDPLFYGHLAGWYFKHGSVRDHQELFVANLLVSRQPEHRQHGRVLLQLLRPYQVGRVIKFTREALHYPTRMLKSAVEFYVRRREADEAWFDECVMRDRKAMRTLYAALHLRPCPRAELILFHSQPPSDSRLYHAGLMGKLQDNPSRQAELIVEHHIHFTTAIGSIRHYTPAIIYALTSVMTGPQLITNLNFLKKRGALEHPHIRTLMESKLKSAVHDSRVSDLKAGVALQQVHADAALAADLLQLTQDRLRNRGRITIPTALFIDKSGSMQQCLEIGKLLATVCSTVSDSDLHVLAFDSFAFPVVAATNSYAAWEKAFSPLRADGATSIGAPFRALGQRRVEQVVVITDGEENTAPYFRPALEEYEKRHGIQCRVVIVRVQATRATPLEETLKGREVTVIPFTGDYYSLPNVIPLLCSSTYELVSDIMDIPLYDKTDLQTLPPGFNPTTFEIL